MARGKSADPQSDYGATHSTVPSALAGMDMELPSVEFCECHPTWLGQSAEWQTASTSGRPSRMARSPWSVWTTWSSGVYRVATFHVSGADGASILTPYFALGQQKSYPAVNWEKFDLKDEVTLEDGHTYRNEHVDNRGDNHLFARKAATESTVYVKRPRRPAPC